MGTIHKENSYHSCCMEKFKLTLVKVISSLEKGYKKYVDNPTIKISITFTLELATNIMAFYPNLCQQATERL